MKSCQKWLNLLFVLLEDKIARLVWKVAKFNKIAKLATLLMSVMCTATERSSLPHHEQARPLLLIGYKFDK